MESIGKTARNSLEQAVFIFYLRNPWNLCEETTFFSEHSFSMIHYLKLTVMAIQAWG
jgi:hypothetical protein